MQCSINSLKNDFISFASKNLSSRSFDKLSQLFDDISDDDINKLQAQTDSSWTYRF